MQLAQTVSKSGFFMNTMTASIKAMDVLTIWIIVLYMQYLGVGDLLTQKESYEKKEKDSPYKERRNGKNINKGKKDKERGT